MGPIQWERLKYRQELRRGIGIFSLFVRAIVVGGVLLGLVHSPRRTFQAWRAGYHPDRVPLQAATLENYERLLQLSVGELRELYGVPSSGITGARQLHYAAPSGFETTLNSFYL